MFGGMFASQRAQRMNGMFASQVSYSPTLLFQAGEHGLWYDNSDFATLFQDAAGTTPVTAVGQAVGLRLDKSKGLVLGIDRVTNGSFATDSDWTKGTGWSIGSGVATKTAGSAAALTQTIGSTAARWYKVTATITRSAGTLTVSLGTSGSTAAFNASYSGAFYILAGSGTQTLSFSGDASFAGTVDNVVVQSIAGNHAYQSSLSSRPVLELVSGCYGLKYDGTDDFYVTNSIDFTGTDKMTVWAGVRKLSDADSQIAELSVSTGASNGVFRLSVPAPQTGYYWLSKGTAGAAANPTTGYTSPVTNILTGIGAISTDTCILRINGAQVASSTADQGTGNYGNYPLYIGRRGGTSLPFNGYDFGIIVRGAQSTSTEIAATERWLAQKTGVTL